DRDALPDSLEQGLLGQELAGPLRQMAKDRERLGPQWDQRAIAPQLSGTQIELEGREVDGGRRHDEWRDFSATARGRTRIPWSRPLPGTKYGAQSEIYGTLYGFFGGQRGIEPAMEDGRTRQPSIPTSEAPLPPERAFVVQLRSLTDPAGELFVGRVEHIASG